MLALQTWEPELETHHPCKKLGAAAGSCNLNAAEAETADFWGSQANQPSLTSKRQVPVKDPVSKKKNQVVGL